MNRRTGFQIGLITAVLTAGVAIGLQHVNWIETWFGIDPDGGNGFLEFLCAMVPVVGALAFAVPALLPEWRALVISSKDISTS